MARQRGGTGSERLREDKYIYIYISMLLPRLMGHTDATAARRRKTAVAPSEETTSRKASSTCGHKRGVTTATRVLLAEESAPGTEATFTKVRGKFGEEGVEMVTAGAEAAVEESRIAIYAGMEGGWRPDNEFSPKTAIEVIKSGLALSAGGNNRMHASPLKRMINTPAGNEGFGMAIGNF